MSLIKDFKDLFFTMTENPNNFAYEDRLMMLVIISILFLSLSKLLISILFSLPDIIHSVIDFCGNILKKFLKIIILTDKRFKFLRDSPAKRLIAMIMLFRHIISF